MTASVVLSCSAIDYFCACVCFVLIGEYTVFLAWENSFFFSLVGYLSPFWTKNTTSVWCIVLLIVVSISICMDRHWNFYLLNKCNTEYIFRTKLTYLPSKSCILTGQILHTCCTKSYLFLYQNLAYFSNKSPSSFTNLPTAWANTTYYLFIGLILHTYWTSKMPGGNRCGWEGGILFG